MSLDGGEEVVNKDTGMMILLDIMYAYHYEMRMLGFSEEESSESGRNII